MTGIGRKGKDRSLDDWLGDMHESAKLVVANTDQKTFEEFRDDVVLRDHVVLRLVSIGEAVKYIDQFFPDFQAKVTTVPWRDLARTRDKLTHSYFGVDPRLVWAMARDEIPAVRDALSIVITARRTVRTRAGLGQGPGIV